MRNIVRTLAKLSPESKVSAGLGAALVTLVVARALRYIARGIPMETGHWAAHTVESLHNWVITASLLIAVGLLVAAYAIIRRDMAERKGMEERLRRANRALRAISESNQTLIGTTTEPYLLQQVCNILTKISGYRLAWVGYAEYDPVRSVRPVAHAGTDSGHPQTVGLTWEETGHGQAVAGTAIRTGKPSKVLRILSDPRFATWREEALKQGYGSAIALPLFLNDHVLGALAIYAQEPDAFDEDEVALLTELSNDLSYGIRTLRAQEELRSSEALFRAVIENSHDGVVLLDANANIKYASPSQTRIGGYTPEELAGKCTLDYVHPDDLPATAGKFQDLLQTFGGSHVSHEYRARHKLGHWFWVETTATNLLNDPNVHAVVISSRDITDRKKAEEALVARQSELAAAQRLAHIGSWQWNVQTDEADWSDETFRIFGRAPGLLEQHRTQFLEMIHAGDQPRVARALADALEGTKEYDLEYRLVRPDGAERIIHAQAEVLRDPAGRPIRMRGTVHDITERRRADDALRESEERFRTLIEKAPLAIAIGRNSLNIYANQKYLQMFGLQSLVDIVGRPIAEQWTPESWAIIEERSLQRSRGFAVPESYEAVGQRRDGSRFPVQIDVTKVNLPDGAASLAFLTDITERKQAQHELQRSFVQLRALAARLQNIREEERKRLAREIHDQAGQALTAIKIDLCALVRETGGDLRHPSERISSLLKLVDGTIKCVRRIATELRPGILDDLGLVAAIEWAGEDFEARTGTKCRLDLPQENIAIDTERATAIFRILQESLTNVVRHAAASEVEVRLAKEDQALTLVVHDNGKGMPADRLCSNNSLGILGMQERALLLGGKVAIDSTPGMGTAVKVRIPETVACNEEKQ